MKNLALFFILFLSLSAFAQEKVYRQSDYVGTWKTYDDKTGKPNGKIELYLYKGSIKAKVLEGANVYNPDGSLAYDKKNPDPKKRNKTIKGMNFMYGFVWNPEKGSFEKGKVYDTRSGNTYSAKLVLVDRNKIKLTGYLGITLFGKSVYWTRIK